MMSMILQCAVFSDGAVGLVCVNFDNDGEDSKSSQYSWVGGQDGAFHCISMPWLTGLALYNSTSVDSSVCYGPH